MNLDAILLGERLERIAITGPRFRITNQLQLTLLLSKLGDFLKIRTDLRVGLTLCRRRTAS